MEENKKEQNEETDSDEFLESSWWALPEPVLIKILNLLPIYDIIKTSLVCRRWHTICNDDIIWKKKLQCDFNIDPQISLKPGVSSWQSEYKRLKYNIPYVQAQRLEGHTHQVLHISFSHNGQMFATCSKDGYVIVWNADHPCTEKFSHNMKQFSWKYTQYSQFNESDTLLLVSGVHFGTPQSTSGEIAVFTVDGAESHYRCRVLNRPYDIFGTWFSDQYLISGDLRWLEHMVSCSELTLNKSNQEIYSEHVPIRTPLYKFYNINVSSVRTIIIAKCPWLDENNDPLGTNCNVELTNKANTSETDVAEQCTENVLRSSQHEATIKYLDEYRNESSYNVDTTADAEINTAAVDDFNDLDNLVPKYLIFSTGSKTYTPHEIGIKRVRDVIFPKKLDPGPSLKERIAAKKLAEQQRNAAPEEARWNLETIQKRCDKIDKIIDLHGHIIGMALSPDHRYLYVNVRQWPENYIIDNPMEPPPIAQEIDIHVIDLMTFKRVGNMLRSHKAYTPSTDCFFIFLDVCEDYVASGAEDMHAYLWDRHYGICLAKYKHTDVVNSVAFNPKDSGMLATASDDYSIKIWRSRSFAKKYGLNMEYDKAFELNAKAKPY